MRSEDHNVAMLTGDEIKKDNRSLRKCSIGTDDYVVGYIINIFSCLLLFFQAVSDLRLKRQKFLLLPNSIL